MFLTWISCLYFGMFFNVKPEWLMSIFIPTSCQKMVIHMWMNCTNQFSKLFYLCIKKGKLFCLQNMLENVLLFAICCRMITESCKLFVLVSTVVIIWGVCVHSGCSVMALSASDLRIIMQICMFGLPSPANCSC